MSLADKALYYAKDIGRNKAVNVVTSEAEVTDSDVVKGITGNIYKAIEEKRIMFEIV